LRTQPYADVTGKQTVCFGETERPVKAYTPDECSVMLVSRLASDYAPAVIKCVPGLADKPKPLAASLALSYNIGVSAFCRSTAAKRFNAGDWTGGCDAFLMWRFAGGKEVRGLLNRRRAERELCLR
jgi:lysozyme